MTRTAQAPSAATNPQVAAGRQRLEALVRRAPELAGAAALYQAMLPHVVAARGVLPAPDVDVQAAQRSLAAGLPVLLGADLALDAEAAARLFIALCRAAETVTAAAAPARAWSFGKRAAGASGPVAAIRRAGEQGRLDLGAVWQALASRDDRRLDELATVAGLEPAWLRLLGQNSLKPMLQATAEALCRRLDLDDWRRGSCPICGSPPLLAEIQGKEGARRLRCGMCGAGWPYPRLQCVVCRTTDHLRLGYLCLEGEGEKYRVQTCDACRGYLKVVVTFDPIPVELLPAEDLATLHLDGVAAERGFARALVAA